MYWSPCETKEQREFPRENYKVGDFKYTRTNPDGWTGGQRVILWQAVGEPYVGMNKRSDNLVWQKEKVGSPIKCYERKLEIITGEKKRDTSVVKPLYRGYIGDGWGDDVDYEWECN